MPIFTSQRALLASTRTGTGTGEQVGTTDRFATILLDFSNVPAELTPFPDNGIISSNWHTVFQFEYLEPGQNPVGNAILHMTEVGTGDPITRQSWQDDLISDINSGNEGRGTIPAGTTAEQASTNVVRITLGVTDRVASSPDFSSIRRVANGAIVANHSIGYTLETQGSKPIIGRPTIYSLNFAGRWRSDTSISSVGVDKFRITDSQQNETAIMNGAFTPFGIQVGTGYASPGGYSSEVVFPKFVEQGWNNGTTNSGLTDWIADSVTYTVTLTSTVGADRELSIESFAERDGVIIDHTGNPRATLIKTQTGVETQTD